MADELVPVVLAVAVAAVVVVVMTIIERAAPKVMSFLGHFLFLCLVLSILSITLPVYAASYWCWRDDRRKPLNSNWCKGDEIFLEKLVKLQRITRKLKAVKVFRLLKNKVVLPNVLAHLISEYNL